MGRTEGRKNISLTVERAIIHAALENLGEPRKALALKLQDLIEKMGEVVPEEETIMRMISWARNHEPDPQDSPWHVVTLAQYEIPPEALPTVLELAYGSVHLGEGKGLTIREARWVARLYRTIPGNVLHTFSKEFAADEKVEKMLREKRIGRTTSSIQLDKVAAADNALYYNDALVLAQEMLGDTGTPGPTADDFAALRDARKEAVSSGDMDRFVERLMHRMGAEPLGKGGSMRGYIVNMDSGGAP